MKVLKVKSFADLVESKTWLMCYVVLHILIGWICTTMKEKGNPGTSTRSVVIINYTHRVTFKTENHVIYQQGIVFRELRSHENYFLFFLMLFIYYFCIYYIL